MDDGRLDLSLPPCGRPSPPPSLLYIPTPFDGWTEAVDRLSLPHLIAAGRTLHPSLSPSLYYLSLSLFSLSSLPHFSVQDGGLSLSSLSHFSVRDGGLSLSPLSHFSVRVIPLCDEPLLRQLSVYPSVVAGLSLRW